MTPWVNHWSLCNVRSPLTAEQLEPLDSGCSAVQFAGPLSDDEFVRLAELMRPYPNVALRVYGHEGEKTDLEFLRHFPFIRRFQADVFELVSLDGLRFLPDSLEYLGLGQTRSKRHSLSPLARFTGLRELFLEGHTRDLDVVGNLRGLEDVTLRSITLPDLDVLTRLPELRSLKLKLGGTTDLGLLPRIEKLRYLELWRILGLADLSVIAELSHLQYLFLQALKNVVALPSFKNLRRLRRVYLQTMKGLHDLQPIADAPALEELVIIDMGHLSPEAVLPFRDHPRLRGCDLGLGSERKRQAARELIGVPPAGDARKFEFRDDDKSTSH